MLLSIPYILVLCSLVIPTETIPRQRSKIRRKIREYRNKFQNELSVKANFHSKIRVNYNNRHCENSANFLQTFVLDKNSPFFVEKPRNSGISSNYVLITFSQYSILNKPTRSFRNPLTYSNICCFDNFKASSVCAVKIC